MTDINDPCARLNQLLGRAATDEALRERLLADPHAELAAEGFELEDGVSLNVVVNTSARTHLVLPARPDALSDEQLDSVAGTGVLVTRLRDSFAAAIERARNPARGQGRNPIL